MSEDEPKEHAEEMFAAVERGLLKAGHQVTVEREEGSTVTVYDSAVFVSPLRVHRFDGEPERHTIDHIVMRTGHQRRPFRVDKRGRFPLQHLAEKARVDALNERLCAIENRYDRADVRISSVNRERDSRGYGRAQAAPGDRRPGELSNRERVTMGYDMTVEARRGGRWMVVAEPPIDPVRRDYPSWVALGFERVADWSDPDYQAPIASSRGFPADASDTLRIAWKAGLDDGVVVGTSWLTLAELLPHRERLDGIVGDLVDTMGKCGPPDDVRLVFWFVP